MSADFGLSQEEKVKIFWAERTWGYIDKAEEVGGTQAGKKARRELQQAAGLSDAALSRLLHCKSLLLTQPQKEGISRLLDSTLDELEKEFELSLCAVAIGEGLPGMGKSYPMKEWRDVRRRDPGSRILGQRLISYQLIIAPGGEAGNEFHVDKQPERDPIPFGDELILLADGRVRLHVDSQRFDLTKPGQAVLLKSKCVHRSEWLSRSGKTGLVGLRSERKPQQTVLTVVRYPSMPFRGRIHGRRD